MKVPIRWLADYVDVETDEASVARLAERLTLAGLEVEEITTTGTLRGVVVASWPNWVISRPCARPT